MLKLITLNCLKMPARIWLIGGTTESVQLASALDNAGLPGVITVLAASAQTLYPQALGLTICTGALTDHTWQTFCRDHQISAILDASHPYATEISKLAMQASTQLQIPYLRFERFSEADDRVTQNPWVVKVDTISQLVNGQYLEGQRVLLTLGSKWLSLFQECQSTSTLFARILPRAQAFQAADDAGFSCDRIIALRPPISFDLEKALWQQWQISVVVTKASGQPGGEDIKRRVAQALGVTLIIIKRPILPYPHQTSDIEAAVQFCQAALHQKPV